MVSTPASTVPTAIRPSEQAKMKRSRSDKKVDFVDINFNEPVNEVLVVLPLETTTVALAHHMYWIEAWKDYTSSTVEDLVATNSASLLGPWAPMSSLKDLKAKNTDLANQLEEAVHYGNDVRATKSKVKKAKKKKKEMEG